MTKWVFALVLLASVAFCNSVARKESKVDSKAATQCDYIPIDAGSQCIDLTGAESAGGVRWGRLFDESTEPCKETPAKTDPLPQFGHGSFFPTGFGLQMVIDLKQPYALTSIWYYSRSFEQDTLWIYGGNYGNKKLIQTCYIDGIPDHWGWKKIDLNQETQWITLRFNSQKAAISELRLFGKRVGIDQAENTSNQSFKINYTNNNLRQFMGVNAYDVTAPDSILRVFGFVRQYHLLQYWENYFKKIDKNSFDKGIQDFINKTKVAPKDAGPLQWASVRGNSAVIKRAGLDIQYPPVNQPNDDLYEIKNYTKHGALFYQMAGSRVGQSFNVWENGNEEDGYWRKHYWTPYQYFLVSSVDWDGQEGRLGREIGIRAADPRARLMMSGMVGLDTQRVRALQFLCRQLRKDQDFIWQGGVQYHHYSNDAQLGKNASRALSPEQDSMRQKLSAVASFHQRTIGRSIPLILGENGYDRNPASWQAAPKLKGFDAEQSQGIFTVRSLMAAFFSGFDQYLYFMLRNAAAEENPPGVFGSSGMISGPGGAGRVYPVWHYWKHLYDWLGEFQADTVVTEQGNVWVYRLKLLGPRKRWVYYLVNSSDQGSVQFTLSTPFVKARQATEMPWFYATGPMPRARTWPVRQGRVQLEVGSVPVFLEFSE